MAKNLSLNSVSLFTAVFGGLGLAFLFMLNLRQIKLTELKNQAVTDCLKSAGSYEYLDPANGARTTLPQKEIYLVCLSDKGYISQWK